MVKHFSSHSFLQAEFSNKCLKRWNFLSVSKHSLILVRKWRLVSPYNRIDILHKQTMEFFTKEQHNNIYPCGSQPARIYDTPKTYELKSSTDTLTFRPILSSMGTYNYNLAKLLTDMLNPVIPTEYCGKDSFSFCKKILEISSSNKFMISYDVCSLFTGISLKEIFDIAVNLIFDKYPDLKITTHELKKLFAFATSGTNFLFDGSYYDQIDGVEMGSPLGPVLTNLFMDFHKKDGSISFNFLMFYITAYMLMILFACLILSKMLMSFLNFSVLNILILNSHVKKKKAKLAFLNLLISKTHQDLCTSVYRKMTSIGLYTDFVSFTPDSYKIGLIKTLMK